PARGPCWGCLRARYSVRRRERGEAGLVRGSGAGLAELDDVDRVLALDRADRRGERQRRVRIRRSERLCRRRLVESPADQRGDAQADLANAVTKRLPHPGRLSLSNVRGT